MSGKHGAKQDRMRTALILLVMVAALFLVYGGGRLLDRQSLKPETRTAYEPISQSSNTIEVDGKQYAQRRRVTTILLMGVDQESGSASGGYRNGGQADFLRLLVIDDEAGRVSQLAIDRDTMTPITVLGVLGNRARTRTAQISLSHGFGDGGAQSCELTVEAVSNLLSSTKIDFYMAMNMGGIAALNDAVGGVTVTVQDDFSALDEEMKPGTTLTLSGAQAELFVRGRMNIGNGTNAARMERQQQYVSQLIVRLDERVREDKNFLGTLYDALGPYLTTNISRGRLINESWAAKDYERSPLVTPAGEHAIGSDGFMEFHVDEDALLQTVLSLFYEAAGE